MKKFVLGLLLTSLIAVILFVPGCSKVSPATKGDIAGTYKLTCYEKKSSVNGDVDLLETEGIESYLVVAENGSGYYVYKDNNTSPYVLKAEIGFVQSEDDADKFGYVTYSTEKDSSPEKLGYDKDVLNKSIPVFKGNLFESTLEVDYVLNTKFIKVDKAQDLSYINSKLPEAAIYAYGEYTYNGYFNKNDIEYPSLMVDYEQADIYVYYFIKLDPLAHKATSYYMLKNEMIRKTVDSDYSVATGVDEYGGEIINLTIGTKVSKADINAINKTFAISYSFNVSEAVYFANLNLIRNTEIDDGNLEEEIENAISAYEESL